MLQLLNPIWLFGIGGILIPLIIHLWNVKTGKTLKVGSITLMGESSRQNSRSLKLMELLLLFLRCLIIILLSVLLTEPVWKSTVKTEENKAWILLEKDNFSETYNKYQNEIDSLLAAGSELHLFQPGFQKADFIDLQRNTSAADTSAKLPYWSLMKLMEQQIPNGSKAFIFTGDRLYRFTGSRPAITRSVIWKTYGSSDSLSKWIDHAYLSSSGDIRAVVSESNPKGTLTKTVSVSPGDNSSDIKASISDGRPELQLNSQIIAADTSTLTIAIYSQEFPTDAEYLTAALSAIQTYTSRKIKFVKPSTNQDVLFWLSSKDLPENLTKNIKPGTSIFQYAKGKPVSANTWMEVSEGRTSLQAAQIPLFKRITPLTKTTAFSIWEDGFSQPLLTLDNKNNRSIYTFYSRFDPEWSDLVWSSEFVKYLLPFVIPEIDPGQIKSLDKRRLERLQILPISDFRPQTSNNRVLKTVDLAFYLWFLLMILFLTERYISFKTTAV
ncbi:MAG: BatA domain-containing protein [Bacteroidota bacterium]